MDTRTQAPSETGIHGVRITSGFAAPMSALLIAGLIAGGSAVAAPRALAASTPAPIASGVAPAAMATTITVTPTTTTRGGIVSVAGVNFAANETIDFVIRGVSGTVATTKADTSGHLLPTNVPVPYTVKPGTYILTATGTASKRQASVPFTVVALAPSLKVSAAATTPGAVETVTGSGFARQEQVTLSLNGESVATTPSVITTTNGAFTATVQVPSSLLRGDNTLSAIGNASRVSIATQLTGNLARTDQFYFAGVPNESSTHSYVALLNTNAQPASARLSLAFDSGAQFTRVVTIPAHSEKRVSVASFGLPEGTFGLTIRADRAIVAQISIGRDGKDGDAILGTRAPALRWYFADGSTKATRHETVSVYNPDPATPAQVQLEIFSRSLVPPVFRTLTVAPHSNSVADINALLPGYDVSVAVISNRPVVTERTLTFGASGVGMTTRAGTAQAATSWLFADGTTENGVRTAFSIINPGNQPAVVTAGYSNAAGGSLGSQSIFIPARSRGTINLGTTVQGGGVATSITSDAAVVVERSEYIGAIDAASAGSAEVGRNGTGTRWTFPGGNTSNRDEAIILYNPSAVTVPITGTFYSTDAHVVVRQFSLAPGAHQAIPVNTLGLTVYHGAVLETTNGLGFIAEQGISSRDSRTLQSTQGYAQ